jgi:CDGSH-type Zn-finger protein
MRITATENGCLLVEAEGRYRVHRGSRAALVESPRIALCRCGRSGSKPYCDTTHAVVGFVAPRTELEVVPVVLSERSEA